MKAGNVIIEKTDEELTEIQSEVLRLEQRSQSVRRTLREAIRGSPLGKHTPPRRRRRCPLPDTN